MIVGTHIGDQPVVQREQRAIGAHANAQFDGLGTRMARDEHVLAALLDPLHRDLMPDCQRRRGQFLRVRIVLGPEGPAHLGRDDA